MDDGHVGMHLGFGQNGADRSQLAGQLLDFVISASRRAVMSQNTVRVLLNTPAVGAPTVEENAVRAAGNAAVPPEPHQIGFDGEVAGRIVEITVFLLEHPEIAVLGAAVEVMPEVGVIHIDIHVRVIVPCREVHVPVQIVHVDLRARAERVVSHELMRSDRLDDRNVHVGVIDRCVGNKTLEVQSEAGIDGQLILSGQADFVPVVIDMAPEDGSPCFIETVERAVFFLHPFLEAAAAGLTVAGDRPELVVDLPADHIGIIGEVLGHFAGHAAHIETQNVAVVAMLASSARAQALLIDRDDLGMGIAQPGGRRFTGGAEDEL